MCGIWFFCAPRGSYDENTIMSYAFSKNLKARGPDVSIVKKIMFGKYDFILVFHRLSIMDLSDAGHQPFKIKRVNEEIYLMCNGEIYSYKHLIEKYKLQDKLQSNSDCEVLIHLYDMLGLEKLYDVLSNYDQVSGEFAMVILHIKDNLVTIHCARDVGGVRPLYYSHTHYSKLSHKIKSLCFSSQLCGIPLMQYEQDEQYVQQVKAYSIHTYSIPFENEFINQKLHKTFDLRNIPISIYDESEAIFKIRQVLTKCVEDRFASDRDIIFMLSGGLDSSICCALGAEFAKKDGKKIKTMCIGMENSTDQVYADMVVKHLDTDHMMIKKTNKDFLDCCKHRVTKMIESYDITTNRASTPQLLSAEVIASETSCKVVIVGDYSDEVCGGYNETKLAPTLTHFRERIHELTEDIIYFDAQRVDRCVAGMGLEARTPFGDHRFIKLYMSIDPTLRVAKDGVEKYLLRKAFEDLLPSKVVWRPKEAFSDGISSLKKSWYEIIQDEINELYTEKDVEMAKEKFSYLTPYTKESLHYRIKFNEFYSDKFASVLPSFWLPKWGGQKDPSARLLKEVYKQ
jgi:asparagine synthase (glutamine-hydrolysing)